MSEKVSIPRKELERLRELLDGAFSILMAHGIELGAKQPPKVPGQKRVPFQKGIKNYMELIESGEKYKLPKHLQNKKTP